MGVSIRPTAPEGYEDLLPSGARAAPDGFEDLIPGHPASIGEQIKAGGREALQFFRHPIQSAEALGKGIAGAAYAALAAPVEGERRAESDYLRGKGIDVPDIAAPGQIITQANTPGAISPAAMRSGALNTLLNVGFAAAPVLSAPIRIAANAGLGALNDPEQRVRGAVAATTIGELLHAPFGLAKVADVSHGLIEAATQDPALRAKLATPPDAAQAGLPFPSWSTRGKALARAEEIANRPTPPAGFEDLIPSGEQTQPFKVIERRAAAALPPESKIIAPEDANAQPGQVILPDAPAPSGPLISTLEAPHMSAEGPLLDRFGVPIEESPNVSTSRYDAEGIGRRPVSELPISQRLPVEPSFGAETQSFGGPVGRRPAGTSITEAPTGFADLIPAQREMPLAAKEPIEPPDDAQTVSFGGQPETTLQPIVSANGTFEARPGVLRKVNADLGLEEIGQGAVPTRESLAAQPDVTGTRSFRAQEITPGYAIPSTAESRPSDILNVAKLDLEDNTAEQRVAAQLEQYRTLRESQRQTFSEADIDRAAAVRELLADSPKALSPAAAKRLSGVELLARRDVVVQNDQTIAQLSKSIESGTLSPAESEQASLLLQKAVEQNDALLSDLVVGSSQKGRDLNLLRRIANRSLDPDVWLIQAKRMLGDRPLTDSVMTDIRRLARAAAEACGGAA